MSSGRIELLLLLASLVVAFIHGEESLFSGHLKLDGVNEILPNGSALPCNTSGLRNGQIFYAQPFKFKPSQTSSNDDLILSSFSTSFVFLINLQSPTQPDNQEGFSFVISSEKWLALNSSVQEIKEEGSLATLISINFKISRNSGGFEDNHLEVSINGVPMVKHSPLGYYRRSSDEVTKVRLTRGRLQVWLDYDGHKREISGSVAPASSSGPKRHSFSYPLDIAPYVSENMFAGISKSNSGITESHLSSDYYILGWSMKMNGKAQEFDLGKIYEFNPRLGSEISEYGVGGFSSGFPSDFFCLGCLEKFLRMMNCTSEQIKVLEVQCKATLSGNANGTKSLA